MKSGRLGNGTNSPTWVITNLQSQQLNGKTRLYMYLYRSSVFSRNVPMDWTKFNSMFQLSPNQNLQDYFCKGKNTRLLISYVNRRQLTSFHLYKLKTHLSVQCTLLVFFFYITCNLLANHYWLLLLSLYYPLTIIKISVQKSSTFPRAIAVAASPIRPPFLEWLLCETANSSASTDVSRLICFTSLLATNSFTILQSRIQRPMDK